MPSIVDMIASAESEAASIRKQGTEHARGCVSEANAKVNTLLAETKQEAMAYILKKHDESEAIGKKLYDEVYSLRMKESKETISSAKSEINRACEYVLERLIV